MKKLLCALSMLALSSGHLMANYPISVTSSPNYKQSKKYCRLAIASAISTLVLAIPAFKMGAPAPYHLKPILLSLTMCAVIATSYFLKKSDDYRAKVNEIAV